MHSRHLIPVVVAAAALSIAAAPARAQSAAPAGTAAATPSHWDAHPTGKYTLTVATPNGQVTASLTLADSAGTTTATIFPDGDEAPRTMAVVNKDTALVMVTVTQRGPMEIVLEKRGDRITGHWKRGDDGGAIEGVPAKN